MEREGGVLDSIFGREGELREIERFLAAVRTTPGALVIEGEAGIGKSTIWLEAVRRAEESGVPPLVEFSRRLRSYV